MGLKNLKSNLDLPKLDHLGDPVENTVPTPDFYTQEGTVDSPFQSNIGDHLVDLLKDNIVHSTNTGLAYDPLQMQGLQSGPPGGDQDLDGVPGPESQLPTTQASQKHIDSLQQVPGLPQNSPYQDLEGVDGGQGYFHGIPNPGKGQGKQIGGKDLHEHLLTETYKYSHGNAPTEIVGPSPGETGNSDYQDLDSATNDQGNGHFHGIPNPGKGQGKQLGGKDLHEHLLTKTYAYNYGNSVEQVGPSPGETGNSEFQDIDNADFGNGLFHGVNNPQKGQGKQIGGKDLHEHLLIETYTYNHGNSIEHVGPSPGETGNSEFQDIDGLFGPKFDKGKPSQIHGFPQDLSTSPTELVADYTSTVNPGANYGNSQWPLVPAVPGGNAQNSPYQDLDGVPGPSFDFNQNGANSTLHTDLLANIYQSGMNPGSSYGAGQPGGIYPSLLPSPLQSNPSSTGVVYADLDGGLPANGEYLNNLPG